MSRVMVCLVSFCLCTVLLLTMNGAISDFVATPQCARSESAPPDVLRSYVTSLGRRAHTRRRARARGMLKVGWSRSDAPAMWKVLDEATLVAENYVHDPGAWWKAMGHAAQFPEQVASFRRLMAMPRLRNGWICEIGFNAGHSAIMWLHDTSARLVEFDLQTLPYSEASRILVESAFPGRVHFHVGKSRQTVPLYASRVRNGTAPPCDLWLVDGDHGNGARHDVMNALSASHAGTIVVVDDASLRFPMLRKCWRIHVALGSIRELSCVQLRPKWGAHKAKGWCFGSVQPWATTAEGHRRLEAEFDSLAKREQFDEMRRRYIGRASNASLAIMA